MTKPGILRAGQLFDRFRIVKKLGSGGMGEVYLALDRHEKRNVALKVIKKDSPNFERMLNWFKREVELYRKIAHPNVVNFIAFGEVDGIHYVALEQIFGISLRQWLSRNGPCSLQRAFSWTQDLVFAIHAAHQQGVVHRDIKPENIMVDRNENVKIIDFGLARVESKVSKKDVDEAEKLLKRGRPRDGVLSGDSGIVGTLSYVAPEVLRGETAGKASDIYALGLVFYEMLTGQILIQDVSSAANIIERHSQIDSLKSFLPRPVSPLAQELEGFVLKMLKSNVEERFSRTNEMVDGMQKLISCYGSELEDSKQSAKKRLAQQELVDSHYWRAMNFFAEERVQKAIEELFNVITFESCLQRDSKETLVRELDILFYRLAPKGEERGRSDGFVLEKDELIELLKKTMRIYRSVADPWATRLKMRVFLRRCRKLLSREEFARLLQSAFSEHVGDPLLTRAFIDGLVDDNPLVAKDVWLKFTKELLAKGDLSEAREELEAYVRRFGEGDEVDGLFKDLFVLEDARADEEEQLSSLLDELLSNEAREQALTVLLAFLKKYPRSILALNLLHDLYEKEGRRQKLVEVNRRLGVVYYWQGDLDLSVSAFTSVLEYDERDALALGYLMEILNKKGALKRIPHDHRLLQAKIARELGLFELLRKELERGLTGTARDEKVYLEIAELARNAKPRREAWPWIFKAGETRIDSGDTAGARVYFERGLRVAKDKLEAADKLRKIKGIRTVFSLSELAKAGQFDRLTAKDASSLKGLRQRVIDGREE